ncbi:MAG: hypothetical protein Q4F41_15960 [Eubacteriales bacterium]|nr:hypothetical protein [Eubacteriales bacterium]
MDASVTREAVLNRLLDSYQAYFDIEKQDTGEKDGLPLAAHCRFYVHSEKYVLVKKAKLWEADSNEYVYIFSMPHLSLELYNRCRDYAYEEGMKLVDPKPGHMYSYITAVFLCDTCAPEAKKALKKCRIYKSFHFSLYGWMDFHTALLTLDERTAFTNHSGRANAKFMKKILNS